MNLYNHVHESEDKNFDAGLHHIIAKNPNLKKFSEMDLGNLGISSTGYNNEYDTGPKNRGPITYQNGNAFISNKYRPQSRDISPLGFNVDPRL